MMQSVLIDSDIAIDFLRGSSGVKEFMVQLWEADNAFLSLLSVYELYAGMQPKEKEDTMNFIHACRLEPLTVEIAELAGDNFRHYRKQGITLTSVDCLIAATAKMNHHKIATRNVRHYPDKNLLMKI